MFSIFWTNLKTSPDSPQPKQWKNCRVACTENDGRLLLVKGTEAGEILPPGLSSA